jgi:hypothetical protein
VDKDHEVQGDENADVPVLVVTGHYGHDERELALAAGANDFLCKPMRGATLRPALTRLLQRSNVEARIGNDEAPGLLPWSSRAMVIVEAARATLATEAARLSGDDCWQFLRRLARALAEEDATVPAFLGGCEACALVGRSQPNVSRASLADVAHHLSVRSLELGSLPEAIVFAVRSFESAGPGDFPIHEGPIAEPANLTPRYLGTLVHQHTGLWWVDWSLGSQLRVTVRGLAAARPIAELISAYGWSSSKRLSAVMRERLGCGLREFLKLIR